MVRGCQKKIIYLKNTQSEMFEEAYFIIRNSVLGEQYRECDMVKEANRILNESFEFKVKQTFFRKTVGFLKKNFVPFLCGGVFGGLIAILILI